MKLTRITLACIILLFLGYACTQEPKRNFEISDFNPINGMPDVDTLEYTIDLTNAIREGIVIPSSNGNSDSFQVVFDLKNNTSESKRYAYKIFYQNESYSFPLEDPRSYRNFYGSWIETPGFHFTDSISKNDGTVTITDSFAILGNPRNESRYKGGEAKPVHLTEKKIAKRVEAVYNVPGWLEIIKKKAKHNGKTLDEQIKLDVIWSITDQAKHGKSNNRWKRNPRVGDYNFVLVCMEEDILKTIPKYYQDVTIADSLGNYRNPLHYYLNVNKDTNILVVKSNKVLRTKVDYQLDKGIYIDLDRADILDFEPKFDQYVNDSDSMFYSAPFKQFFHNDNSKSTFANIPMSYDVTGDDYTREEYLKNQKKFDPSTYKKDCIKNSGTLGGNVGYDPENKGMYLINRGEESTGKFTKENVGIISRHGLTYGKYTAKIEWPEIASQEGVWNGITCAFWLIYQEGNWNMRSKCKSKYHAKGMNSSDWADYSPYSEIDIEIVKTSKYWPSTSYPKGQTPVDSALNNNIIFSCTNWDLACKDPENFNKGAWKVPYKDTSFELHRWDQGYRAVTSKFEIPHDAAMGKPYYYQIDWQPERIIWRCGPSKDKLRVIGYMDSKSTAIPDNQMVVVLTQEYHLAKWWPLTPYKQDYIPYPKKDHKGYLYSIEVE